MSRRFVYKHTLVVLILFFCTICFTGCEKKKESNSTSDDVQMMSPEGIEGRTDETGDKKKREDADPREDSDPQQDTHEDQDDLELDDEAKEEKEEKEDLFKDMCFTLGGCDKTLPQVEIKVPVQGKLYITKMVPMNNVLVKSDTTVAELKKKLIDTVRLLDEEDDESSGVDLKMRERALRRCWMFVTRDTEQYRITDEVLKTLREDEEYLDSYYKAFQKLLTLWGFDLEENRLSNSSTSKDAWSNNTELLRRVAKSVNAILPAELKTVKRFNEELQGRYPEYSKELYSFIRNLEPKE